MSGKDKAKVWKHIGLYGHAVGTFAADSTGITWKSAAMGGNYGDGGNDIETKRSVPKASISGALWTVFGKSGHLRVLIRGGEGGAAGGGSSSSSSSKLPSAMRFDGFPPSDYDAISEAFSSLYGVTCKRHPMSAAGSSWGNTDISNKHLVFRRCRLDGSAGGGDNGNDDDGGEEEGEEFEPRDGDEMLSLDLAEVSQCVLPGNNRNEIEMQFLESDTVEAGTDQLVAIRFYVPPDADADPTDKDAPTSAEVLQSQLMNVASVKKTSGAVIAEFDEGKGTFLTPRGRYSIELYDAFLRMRGAKYDYKIRYDDISRLFLLPRQDDMHMAFVIALDKPIRQGQQRYNMLVMQCTKEHSELNINLDDATLEREYGGDIQSRMEGSFSNLVAKTFKVITRKKVFIPGKFANANQQACVKCALRANEGHLYPLEKQFIFIHKPAVLIRFDEIESVEFQRYAGGQGSTRNFDLSVTLRSTPGDALSTREYTFSGIDKTNYAALYSFLSGKKIRIANHEGAGMGGEDDRVAMGGGIDASDRGGVGGADADDDGEESSEDDDYDEENPSDGGSDKSGGGSDDDDDDDEDDDDDDDLGSVASDGSDLKEARKTAAKAKKKGGDGKKSPSVVPSKKRKEPPSTSSSSPVAKKKAAVAAAVPAKKTKKKKDPNAPKNAKSSFMFFSVAKRAAVKDANPDATFGDIGKLVGVAWKELSDADKAKWDQKAREDKDRYKKEMDGYSAPSDDDDDDDDDSDSGKAKGKPKAKPKAKKDPNEPKKPMNAYMLFSNSVRAKVREENPGLSLGEVAKEMGSRYKAMSADEMAGWQAKADAAKEVYKKEMAKYDLTRPPETKTTKKPAAAAASAAVKKKLIAKAEGKKKKPELEPESSEESDDSESESDDSDDSDSDSD
jgi:structure-specific recognition protein 1